MYPQRELIQLALHKATLQRRIGFDRARCVAAAARVAQPLAWLDRLQMLLRQITPLMMVAAIPLGFVVKRTLFSRLKFLGSLVSWGPLIFGALRGGISAAQKRFASSAR